MNRSLLWLPLLLSCWPVAALAQSDEATVEAKKRFAEGLALHDAHREQEAYLKFSQAYAISKEPAVIFNLARTEQLTGRPLDAYEHFTQYLRLPDGPKVSAALRDKARASLADLSAQLGRLSISAAAGSQIVVDGNALPEVTPLPDPVPVLPGSHVVEAKLGSQSKTASVTVTAGHTAPVEIPFENTRPAVAMASPARRASTPPNATDSVAPSFPTKEDATSPPTAFWNARRIIGAGAAALGVVSLVLSADFAAQSQSAANDAAALRGNSATCGTNCAALENAYSSQGSYTTLNRVFLGVGLVGAAAGAVLFFWPTSSASAKHTAIVPIVTGSSLQLQGEF